MLSISMKALEGSSNRILVTQADAGQVKLYCPCHVTPASVPYISLHRAINLHNISDLLLCRVFHCLQHYIELNSRWLLTKLHLLKGQHVIHHSSPGNNTVPAHSSDRNNIIHKTLH